MPSCVRARTFVGQRPRSRGRVALTRIRFPRAEHVLRQRRGRRRCAPCSTIRSRRSSRSLTLAPTATNAVNETDRAAITASPRASRWRASAPGIGGRQGRAPLEQLAGSRGACLRMGSIIGDRARSHVSVPGSMLSASAPGHFLVTSMRPRSRRAGAHPLPRAERGVAATSGSPALRAALRSLAMLGPSGFADRHAR